MKRRSDGGIHETRNGKNDFSGSTDGRGREQMKTKPQKTRKTEIKKERIKEKTGGKNEEAEGRDR